MTDKIEKNKQLIVYEVGTKTIVNAIAAKINCDTLLDLNQALKKANELDVNTVGLVVKQDGKSVSKETIGFINNFFSAIDLNKLEYLFVAVVGPEKPYHSLKVIERLCVKTGCAPSYSLFIDEADRADLIKTIAKDIKAGEIKLSYGSFGTSIYMKLNRIK